MLVRLLDSIEKIDAAIKATIASRALLGGFSPSKKGMIELRFLLREPLISFSILAQGPD